MELSIDQVKELVLFAKQNGVTRLGFGPVTFDIPSATYATGPMIPEVMIPPEQRELEAKREADAILYHSSG